MYSGIIRECNNLSETYSGGGLMVGGTFNMYGGEIVNCKTNGSGGGVFIANTGVFNHYGGTIHGCLSKGRGGGIAGSHYDPDNTYSKYHVSGNAVIENNYSLETPSHENNISIFGRSVVGAYDGLTVAGNYTGHCGIYMTEAEENMRFGTALDNATLFSKNITCDNKNLKAAVGDETTTAGEKELVWVAV